MSILPAQPAPGTSGEPGMLKQERATRLGRHLRAIREALGYSLMDVERMSGGRLKETVIRSYERAARGMTVVRLEELAELYAVPSHVLLPTQEEDEQAEGDLLLLLAAEKAKERRRERAEASAQVPVRVAVPSEGVTE